MSLFRPAERATKADAGSKPQSALGETLRTFIYAVIIAFGVRSFGYEPFNIPSGSMIPTLLIGDYLFVSKFSYGYSRFTLALGIPLFEGRIFGSLPQRGDVAVFKLPRDNKTDYIKRIVGLPGDRIQIIAGVLNINGTAAKLERVEDAIGVDHTGRQIKIAQFQETLPNGKVHRIYKERNSGPHNNTQVYVVPPRNYFMMGDNRDNSLDSRFPAEMRGVGFVPEENLVGRAEFIFFSLEEGTRFWEMWRWPFDVRLGRLLQGVN
ncbi:MAG: signal peptidase I [Rhodospirillaceae bacterium]